MEQIGRIKSYVVRLTPYANVINMRKFTGITSDRKRLIASKRPLHKLQELDDDEYKRRFKSPRQSLQGEYGNLPKENDRKFSDSDKILLKIATITYATATNQHSQSQVHRCDTVWMARI